MNGKIHRGIETGLNAAFVIDGAKRAELIATDPKSAEIIKPLLRGRDVKRWRVESRDSYLIAVQNSGDQSAHNVWANATSEIEARAIFKAIYPAIHDHLTAFETQLRIRQGQSRYWWELRAYACYLEFEKPKIVWGSLATKPQFTIDTTESYVCDSANIILGGDMAYLIGIMNSPVAAYIMAITGVKRHGGYIEYKPVRVLRLPIPDAPDALRTQISALAEACLAAAPDHPDRLPGLELQLNALVYRAYGLTEAEIQTVEGIK